MYDCHTLLLYVLWTTKESQTTIAMETCGALDVLGPVELMSKHWLLTVQNEISEFFQAPAHFILLIKLPRTQDGGDKLEIHDMKERRKRGEGVRTIDTKLCSSQFFMYSKHLVEGKKIVQQRRLSAACCTNCKHTT